MIFFCISSSTRLSHPGRAFSGRFLQTSQIEDASAAEERARVRLAHLCLDRPAPINDKPCTDEGRYECFPGIGVLMGKNDNKSAIWIERLVASLEDTSHTVFVVGFGLLSVTSKTARIIDEFAIVLF